MARQSDKGSSKDAGGGGSNGGGGKRGMTAKGWEKGDIARDMVMQPGDPEIPRKPGSRRTDKTLKVPENKQGTPTPPAERLRAEKDK